MDTLTVQRMPATRAVRRLDRQHRLYVLQRNQRPCLALVTWVPPGLAATGRASPLLLSIVDSPPLQAAGVNRHLTRGFSGDAKSPEPGVSKGDGVPFGQGRD